MLSFSHIQTASNEKQDGKWLVICMWEGQTAVAELEMVFPLKGHILLDHTGHTM